MKDNIMKYILIVSLLLNFTLLGTAGYTRYRQFYHHPASFVRPLDIPASSAPFASGDPIGGHLFENLALKPDQIKVFREKAIRFHGAMAKKKEEVDRLKTMLIALLRTDNPEFQALDSILAQVSAAQLDMEKIAVSHLLDFKSMLNRKQQEKFLRLIEDAHNSLAESQSDGPLHRVRAD